MAHSRVDPSGCVCITPSHGLLGHSAPLAQLPRLHPSFHDLPTDLLSVRHWARPRMQPQGPSLAQPGPPSQEPKNQVLVPPHPPKHYQEGLLAVISSKQINELHFHRTMEATISNEDDGKGCGPVSGDRECSMEGEESDERSPERFLWASWPGATSPPAAQSGTRSLHESQFPHSPVPHRNSNCVQSTAKAPAGMV